MHKKQHEQTHRNPIEMAPLFVRRGGATHNANNQLLRPRLSEYKEKKKRPTAFPYPLYISNIPISSRSFKWSRWARTASIPPEFTFSIHSRFTHRIWKKDIAHMLCGRRDAPVWCVHRHSHSISLSRSAFGHTTSCKSCCG